MSNDPFDIVIVPDPVLRERAVEVSRVDDALRLTFERMHASMTKAEGIGLAANQVGLLHRICIVDLQRDGHQKFFMTNPEIVWASEQMASENEGCLSIPGYRAVVERPAHIRVRYVDVDNIVKEHEATGLEAACIQHEIDHLNGVLFIDHISRLKRDVILRKLAKDIRLQGGIM